jgi:hypothetical protein
MSMPSIVDRCLPRWSVNVPLFQYAEVFHEKEGIRMFSLAQEGRAAAAFVVFREGEVVPPVEVIHARLRRLFVVGFDDATDAAPTGNA